jgi:hypothetical protein
MAAAPGSPFDLRYADQTALDHARFRMAEAQLVTITLDIHIDDSVRRPDVPN